MPKYIFVSSCAGADRARSRALFLREVAPLKLRDWGGLERYVVDRVDGANFSEAAPSPFDLVEEAWFETADDFAAARIRDVEDRDVTSLSLRTHVYQVSETVQVDDLRQPRLGERSPGIKVIYLVRRNELLNDREARVRWKDHATLAKMHHAGISRYVQNGVIKALTPDAPVAHGIAELHFPTRDDLEERFYDSDQGRAAIEADVSTLVAESQALYTSEYVLRI